MAGGDSTARITPGSGNLLLERRQPIKIKIPSLAQLAPISPYLGSSQIGGVAPRISSEQSRRDCS
jgi:hypothetical protein